MSWPASRIGALILAVLFLPAAIWFITKKGLTWPAVLLLGGSVIGALYVVNGGRLPDALVNASGGRLTHDDDAGNISIKIYGPILAVLLAGFAGAIYFTLKK